MKSTIPGLLSILIVCSTAELPAGEANNAPVGPADSSHYAMDFNAPEPWFQLGGSFDFANGLNVSDLYGGLSVFQPAVFGDSLKTWESFGIDAGFSQSRSFSKDSIILKSVRPGTDSLEIGDDLVARHGLGGTVRSVDSRNLTIYVSITFQTVRDLFLVLHADGRRKDNTITFVRRIQASDSLAAPVEVEERIRETTFDALFGVGPMYQRMRGDFGLRIKPVVGMVVYGGRLQFGYLIQFHLMEYTHGLAFGGEIRGRNVFMPEVAIHLAKTFRFEDLLRLF